MLLPFMKFHLQLHLYFIWIIQFLILKWNIYLLIGYNCNWLIYLLFIIWEIISEFPGVGIMKLVLVLLVGLAAAQFEERVAINFKLELWSIINITLCQCWVLTSPDKPLSRLLIGSFFFKFCLDIQFMSVPYITANLYCICLSTCFMFT